VDVWGRLSARSWGGGGEVLGKASGPSSTEGGSGYRRRGGPREGDKKELERGGEGVLWPPKSRLTLVDTELPGTREESVLRAVNKI